jgi:predicted alpha/beta superfamily hydrolase
VAIHALLTRPSLFDAVIAVSPSLWFGDGLFARETVAARSGSTSRRLLIAEGDAAAPAGGVTGPNTAPSAPFARLAGLRPQFLALPGQSHGTTFLAAAVPAIRFAFGKPE